MRQVINKQLTRTNQANNHAIFHDGDHHQLQNHLEKKAHHPHRSNNHVKQIRADRSSQHATISIK